MPRKAKPQKTLSDEEYEHIYGRKRPVFKFNSTSPLPDAIARAIARGSDAKKS